MAERSSHELALLQAETADVGYLLLPPMLSDCLSPSTVLLSWCTHPRALDHEARDL